MKLGKYLFASASIVVLASPGVAQTASPSAEATTTPQASTETTDSNTPAAKSPGTDGMNAVGDIVVTAQKREQRLQDVPISIEVVSGAKLQNFNVGDFRQMARFAPNVTVVNSPTNDAIYIRGFGSTPGNAAFDPSVSLYVDGVYAGRQKQAQGPFFDLARVEVLRGPQGALFGKNTAAGAVSVVTAGPTATFSAGARALYNFDIKGPSLEGFVSGPLSDTFGARLAVRYRDQDGWVTNNYDGSKGPAYRQALARLTLRYQPSTTFDYDVKLEYGDTRVRGSNDVATPVEIEAVPRLTRYATPNRLGDEGSSTKSFLASGTGKLTLGDHTLTSVTGYSRYTGQFVASFDQTIPAGSTVSSNETSFPEKFHQFSQEIRLASPTGGRFEYLVGAYYDHSIFDSITLFSFNVQSAPVLTYVADLASNFHQETDTYSLFGQGTFRFNEQFRLVASLRDSKTNKSADYAGRLVSGPFPILPVTSAVGKISENSIDPSATIQYNPSRDIMLYATYARGSKSGGFVSNTFGTTDDTFAYRPEKSENYEAGVKSTLAGGAATLNVSVYQTSFKDLQTSSFDPITVSQQIRNAGQARSRGVEGFAGIRASSTVDFNVSAAYSDAKYTNYPGAPCLATQTNCSPETNNIAGTPLPYNSKFSYSAQGHARLPIDDVYSIDATAALTGRSKSFIAVDLSPVYGIQKSFAKLDARLQYGRNDGRWFVALIGNNLTNELTATASYAIGFPIVAVSRAFRHIDQPRNISIEAGFKF